MYLGLDLGTSGLKGVLIGEDQTLLGEASAALTVQRPHDGWSEQNPADWLGATEAVMTDLGRAHDLTAVQGIGLSGHMHGATLLDAAGEVLRPCMLWNDTRSHREAAAMDADPLWRDISGNIVFPGFTAPKVAWVFANEPEVFANCARVLLPKDYLRYWLTGEFVSEMSDAAGTSWLDTGARDWSDRLLSASGLTRDHMPRLVEGSAVSGHLRSELAHRWGLRRDVVFAGGAGDNAASAVGMGVVQTGQAFISLGTSGVLFASSSAYQPDAPSAVHTFCHALPDTWHQMGVILACTDALNWYASLVGSDAQTLTGELGSLEKPSQTLFLPYLGGERTPHNDAAARGAFLGLGHATDRTAGARAVLEGVAYAFADCATALKSTGTIIDSLVAVGGGSRSEYWLKLLATVLDMPIDVPEAGDFGGAFGAARLGQMAATGGGAELAQPPSTARTIAPDTELSDAFEAGLTRYRAAYHALREAL
ncbi:xylulokinase [uncultured Roseobacter sp.]|uniref:xylulokinase n=1 Tax=uncultured Roseobacter sp. TaxID=114847 RepID=UPI00260CA953|nr:xylulokinase [uncultured Roseobacter sp.]